LLRYNYFFSIKFQIEQSKITPTQIREVPILRELPQAGGTAIQDLLYIWDASGNMATRVNAPALETESFTYDFLDRLTAVSNAYTQSYAYNQIGNITSMNGTSYTYGTKPHAGKLKLNRTQRWPWLEEDGNNNVMRVA